MKILMVNIFDLMCKKKEQTNRMFDALSYNPWKIRLNTFGDNAKEPEK